MTPLYHYIGWTLLGCMAVLSASIIAPGLLVAIRVLFSGASVASPAPRRPQLRVVEADTELILSNPQRSN